MSELDHFLQLCRGSSDPEMVSGATDVLATLRADGARGFGQDGFRFLRHWQSRGGQCGRYADEAFEIMKRRLRRRGDFDELRTGERIS